MSKLHAFNNAALTAQDQENTQGQWGHYGGYSFQISIPKISVPKFSAPVVRAPRPKHPAPRPSFNFGSFGGFGGFGGGKGKGGYGGWGW